MHPWAPGSQLWQQTFTLKHPEDRALGVFWKSNFKTWEMFEGFFKLWPRGQHLKHFFFIFKALIEKVITHVHETWLLVLSTPSFRTKVTWKLAVVTQMWPTSVVFFRPPLVHRSSLNKHGRCAVTCWCPDVSAVCVLMFISPRFQIPAFFYLISHFFFGLQILLLCISVKHFVTFVCKSCFSRLFWTKAVK